MSLQTLLVNMFVRGKVHMAICSLRNDPRFKHTRVQISHVVSLVMRMLG